MQVKKTPKNYVGYIIKNKAKLPSFETKRAINYKNFLVSSKNSLASIILFSANSLSILSIAL